MAADILSHERVRELLHYDPETGHLTWLVRTSNRIKVGDRAGSDTKVGYRRIRVDGCSYEEHRFIVFWMTGAWPEHDVDHKFGNRSDNRWEFLRPMTRQANIQNQRKPHSDTTSGYLGVSWNTQRQRWKATIYDATRKLQKHLGFYDDPAEAHQAYLKAKRERHESCTI